MSRLLVSVCGAATLALFGSGCVSVADHDDLKARYSALSEKHQRALEDLGRRNADLELQVEKRDAQLETKDVMLDAASKELAAAKAIQEEIMAKFSSLTPPTGSTEEGDITYGNNWIRFSGEVLFESGKTELKAQGKQLLLEVAKELKAKGMFIQVDGHTDTDPIKRSIGKFPTGSNFELGAERALTALLFLQKEGGIEPGMMHMTSWGEHQPAETGNKRKNRRIEIRFSAEDPYVTGGEIKSDGR
ncbi:MAG: OmpA family protein [Candidatus Brocadiae bacterium]|nr:OmpA family protein [Candidatus Brocadiia bacterium]